MSACRSARSSLFCNAVLLTLTFLALQMAIGQPGGFHPPPEEEFNVVKARLGPLQQLSFATDLEYCGYLGRAATGELVFTEMQRGGHNGCTPEVSDEAMDLIASVHTHGSYDHHVPAEFPTVLDMESDAHEGVDGYIATPGGRLWYIDSEAFVAVQLCGLGCLPQDPNFVAGDDGVIPERLTLDQMLDMEGE